MQITIDNVTIIADGYIPIPEDLAIQFYKEKSDLDYIPSIKVNANLLSDFGRSILYSRNKEDKG